ncbi:NUDIX hydrolase [Nocardia cyriacigeorgica]|uniref:NUDIX hydrolase n=1 Tax=Nocardia cyriacigeorgica TaxID=135487 RepID=UPI001895426E|nr:NUDIX hydrolase [Nocardia cyriacigeorgica]MBF6345127.1 NUDIX hydrolase [Nocardia cyriacigeorgica]MBF6395768.1 NUDIX hydrolase [Nocardia cyriacigeorgica]MBF6401400.1 NUDIX hydrolase [Nocardia cyriacigeorgica]
MAKKEGTQIILANPRHEVLMYLRDDKPDILYPNMWSLLGGMIEAGETPAECVVREIEEEIGVQLDPDTVQFLCTRDLDFGIEHTFTAAVDFDIDDVVLTEGQGLRWFSQADAATTQLAYADNAILETFFGSLENTTV